MLQISIDGQLEGKQGVETGVLQGSPISPILFLIYIRDLFLTLKDVQVLSYVDNVSLSTASTSLRKNAKILQREVHTLTRLGKEQTVQFDAVKTELIHFSTGRDSDYAITLPDGDIIKPAIKSVR